MTQALPRLPVHEAEPKVEDRTKNECEKPTHECKVRLGIRLTQELNGGSSHIREPVWRARPEPTLGRPDVR